MKNLFAFWIFSCFLNLSIICFTLQVGKPGQPLERIDGTCGLRNLPIVGHYHGSRIEGTTVVANASLEVKEDIMTDPTFQLKVIKCKSADNLDTCEQVPDIKLKNVCNFFDSNNPMWAPTFSAVEPRMRCPIKKNIYRTTHGEFDMKMFFMLPPQPQYWKMRVELKHNETRRMLLCILVETHVSMKW